VRFLRDVSGKAGEPAESVALLHRDTLFGTSTADGQMAAAEEQGIEVPADISYPGDAADMSSTIARIKVLDPDAVLLVSYIDDAMLVTNTMKELDVNIRIIGTSAGHIDPARISGLGEDAEYNFTSASGTPTSASPGSRRSRPASGRSSASP
jgi:branched-chain amino acid transport system substrate-binding protein